MTRDEIGSEMLRRSLGGVTETTGVFSALSFVVQELVPRIEALETYERARGIAAAAVRKSEDAIASPSPSVEELEKKYAQEMDTTNVTAQNYGRIGTERAAVRALIDALKRELVERATERDDAVRNLTGSETARVRLMQLRDEAVIERDAIRSNAERERDRWRASVGRESKRAEAAEAKLAKIGSKAEEATSNIGEDPGPSDIPVAGPPASSAPSLPEAVVKARVAYDNLVGFVNEEVWEALKTERAAVDAAFAEKSSLIEDLRQAIRDYEVSFRRATGEIARLKAVIEGRQ